MTTLTIIIDFGENIWNSGVAMKQSENLKTLLREWYIILLERFFHKKFSINRKKFEKWFAESEMSADFGCAHILFEDKASFQLTSRTKSHIHGNVTESHLFCRFLISLSKILKRSIRVCSRFTGKGLAKKMPKLLFLVLQNNLI